jgi:hypothetical protein
MPAAIALIADWLLVALRFAWVWIVRTAVRWVPTLAGQVLLAFGVKLVAFGPGMSVIRQQVIERFDLVPATALETLYYLNVDDFVSLILAALLAAQAGKVVLRKTSAPSS